MKHDQGVSHHGVGEWYWQRASAVLLMFLLPCAFYVLGMVYAGVWQQSDVLRIVQMPWVRVLHSLLLMALLLHAYLGIKVVIEDYLHITGIRVSLMFLITSLLAVFGIAWLALIWGWA
ncbi:MAG: succinate dehydrogenase, hydrophobic membrane anchor protein [Zetaproteobacteria bacterium CG_4_9_14_3_um_filter_49_83]|nr:MAG: succinate dehydrogenase, hydrophobic membrane anchor protein [Zetaproteobacteria bacterium CG1_02_49_23]PIQ30442.1 MAG: succinate dehydrogenase, hydrophobic membrane anchor protein [Zetaproteobacteria bacterium CG17_big_fil_post_rev_8_21_14_2_50_50_13]PIV29298.1 MAG: succinate dehydrogenase, hydrophobic membrane anchor protein [Zetaproteobacteria bacterium CG02_land_8_20_14_3_00_50_9]PIY56280.1 MAG: succinate dehydrogenase, hydrophobic membrane anchor protein [Zetaproteobacteria bacteriu